MDDQFKPMKISELISVLEKTKEEEGDLPVKCTTMGVGFLAETDELSMSLIEVEEYKGKKTFRIGD